jgi:hypothetical protein
MRLKGRGLKVVISVISGMPALEPSLRNFGVNVRARREAKGLAGAASVGTRTDAKERGPAIGATQPAARLNLAHVRQIDRAQGEVGPGSATPATTRATAEGKTRPAAGSARGLVGDRPCLGGVRRPRPTTMAGGEILRARRIGFEPNCDRAVTIGFDRIARHVAQLAAPGFRVRRPGTTTTAAGGCVGIRRWLRGRRRRRWRVRREASRLRAGRGRRRGNRRAGSAR